MNIKKQLKEIELYVGGTVIGNENITICNVRGINEAGKGDLTFLANPQYRGKLSETKASAVLVSPGIKATNTALVVVSDPYKAFAQILALFHKEEADTSHRGENAYIDETASIAEDAIIYPNVYIGKHVQIEAGVVIWPGCFIGNHVSIGQDSLLYPNVTVYHHSVIGKHVILHAGVVIGADGFGFANPGKENLKVPQTGIVQIDNNVEIGANTTVDRGTLGKTWIKEGAKIDNLVQIAHNVVVGENSIIVAQVGISGSSHLGKGVILGGQVGVVGHITVGDHAMVGAQSGVHEDVPPNQVVSGSPYLPHRAWLRTQACLPQLPEMRKTLKLLLNLIEELEALVKKS